jgi:hypothetical protein
MINITVLCQNYIINELQCLFLAVQTSKEVCSEVKLKKGYMNPVFESQRTKIKSTACYLVQDINCDVWTN